MHLVLMTDLWRLAVYNLSKVYWKLLEIGASSNTDI